jgi:acetoin utilization deacetylase AcuC-like enzyme
VQRILVVDLDVHQGNGTASIFAGHDQVFTFSVHGANNYPLRKETSHLDLALPDHTPDAPYLEQLAQQLSKLVARQKPDIIFFQAGVDVLASDLLGKLSLSREGCRQRDQLVAHICYSKGIPLAVCMGGGYSARLADVVEAHCNTFRVMLSQYEC